MLATAAANAVAAEERRKVNEVGRTGGLMSGSSPGKSPTKPKRRHAGFMFFCDKHTRGECLERSLFGLASSYFETMGGIIHEEGPGRGAPDGASATAVFLFSFDKRVLEGVFVATAPAALNVVPDAWKASRKGSKKGSGSPFPAQLRVRRLTSTPVDAVPEDRFSTGPMKKEAVGALMERLRGNLVELGGAAPESQVMRSPSSSKVPHSERRQAKSKKEEAKSKKEVATSVSPHVSVPTHSELGSPSTSGGDGGDESGANPTLLSSGASSIASPRPPPGDALPGFIFFCNSKTAPECLSKCLFGDSPSMLATMRKIVPEVTSLLLFNFETRQLHGVFVATEVPGLNLA